MTASSEIQEPDAAFEGTVRALEEGVPEFSVALPSRPRLYGEWRAVSDDTGYVFSILICSFGYVDPRNVGNPHGTARATLGSDEIVIVERSIKSLFENEEKRSEHAPFTSKRARFDGDIQFFAGWVQRASI